ncbi:MAG TPA: hypothetical protein VN703_00485 [Candidatus Sulfopaludibacter sp.]|nr:hypothetical protein [Candidatus Sulfopaludibacter sp.]
MSTRLDYVKYDDDTIALQNKFKKLFQDLEKMMGDDLVHCRENQLAITKLEESWMWVGKSLKIHQENKDREKNLKLGIQSGEEF